MPWPVEMIEGTVLAMLTHGLGPEHPVIMHLPSEVQDQVRKALKALSEMGRPEKAAWIGSVARKASSTNVSEHVGTRIGVLIAPLCPDLNLRQKLSKGPALRRGFSPDRALQRTLIRLSENEPNATTELAMLSEPT